MFFAAHGSLRQWRDKSESWKRLSNSLTKGGVHHSTKTADPFAAKSQT